MRLDVIAAQAGLSTAELVIHLLWSISDEDQNGFPLARE
jgi:hypothetical protein